jgi:hypothetical protein
VSTATTPGETPSIPAPTELELWTRAAVLRFFGGDRPLHVSTLYRGIQRGRYPKPIRVSGNNARWLAGECRGALARMIAARDEPKLAEPRGRPRRNVIT